MQQSQILLIAGIAVAVTGMVWLIISVLSYPARLQPTLIPVDEEKEHDNGTNSISDAKQFLLENISENRTLVTDNPIKNNAILKVNTVDVKEKRSKADGFVDLVAEAEKNRLGVIFKIVNLDTEDSSIDLDWWEIQPQGSNVERMVLSREDGTWTNGSTLRAGESKEIGRVNLTSQEQAWWFDAVPGRYEILLMGFSDEDWKRYDELEEQGLGEYEKQDRAAYFLKVEAVIGFDEELLTESMSKVLLLNKTLIAVEEFAGDTIGNKTSRPYHEVSSEFPKRMIVYLVNNDSSPMSLKIQSDDKVAWHAASGESESTGGIADFFDESCGNEELLLQPGQAIEVQSILLDKTKYPLGGEFGISERKLNFGTVAKEGWYVAFYGAGVSSCIMEDGTRLPAYSFGAAMAFEVK